MSCSTCIVCTVQICTRVAMSCSTCIVCTVQICTRVEGAAVPVLFVLFRYVQELQ